MKFHIWHIFEESAKGTQHIYGKFKCIFGRIENKITNGKEWHAQQCAFMIQERGKRRKKQTYNIHYISKRKRLALLLMCFEIFVLEANRTYRYRDLYVRLIYQILLLVFACLCLCCCCCCCRLVFSFLFFLCSRVCIMRARCFL